MCLLPVDPLTPESLIRLYLQSLASAIAATKVLSAQQVVKNESGEEVRESPLMKTLQNGGSLPWIF